MQTSNFLPVRNITNFSGLWLPLITPFRGGAVDHASLAKLVQQYSTAGLAGFVVCGSTGEAAALDADEQLAVLATVFEACDSLPVVMGVSGYHMPKMLAWVKTLAAYPLAGLLVPAPYYIRPSQAGLLHWFGGIAEAAHAPVLIYDIPYRTGANLSTGTLLALAAHPNIVGIKDCGGDAAKTQALLADGRLQVLAGEDAQLFASLALGAAGSISASAHLRTTEFAEVIRLLQRGELAKARHIWQDLLPVIEALFAEPNPASIKAALAQRGLIANELRAPMTVAGLPVSACLLQD